MDPYPPPQSELGSVEEVAFSERGLPCKQCGSLNTSKDKFFRSKPSVISVMLFG